MSIHLYESSVFSENLSASHSSRDQPVRRESKGIIALSILITVCLILSISALVIALLPVIGNEDADTAATLPLQKSKIDVNARNLEMLVIRLESAKKELGAALNQTQERIKELESLEFLNKELRTAFNQTQQRLKGLDNLESANKELGAALNQTQERLKLLENSTAVRFQEVDVIVNPASKGKFSCSDLKIE